MKVDPIRKIGSTGSGFTLIELLVTISIVAVLASISLPMYQKSMLSARRIKGISNLKQTGGAVMSYAADHDSTLPGPCALGVVPTYNSKSVASGDLAGFLAPYFGLTDPSTMTGTTYRAVPVLVSPGMAASSSTFTQVTSRIPHYIQSDVLKGSQADGSTGTVRPFGSDATHPPIKLARLGDFTNVTTGLPMSSVQAWLLSDVDQQSTDAQAKASGWFASLPTKPVYVTNRLRIYADGHAAAAGLTEL